MCLKLKAELPLMVAWLFLEEGSLNIKNGKFLTMIILLAFSLPFAYGGCGGSTSDLVDTGGKPHISNLSYTPQSADLGSGGGSISVFGLTCPQF